MALASDDAYEVLIVGAGPAGASLALRLARAGVRTGLLDARAFPRSKPCGDAVSPGATPLLRELGVWDDVRPGAEAGGAALEGWRIRAHDGSWIEAAFDDEVTGSPTTGLAIDRRVLDETLVRHARSAGATLHERTRAFGLLTERGRVTGVRVRDAAGRDGALRAGFVVGADGLRSRVARLLGPVRGGRRQRLGLVARFDGIASAPPWGELRLSGEGVLGYAPTSRTTCNMTLVVPAAAARELRGDRVGFFRERIRAYEAESRVAGGGLSRRIEVTGPFEASPRRRIAPGALLVGDAWGYFDPFTGQGVYHALLGARLAAAAIAEILADPRAEPEALARYERAQTRELRPVRGLQRMVDHVVSRRRLMTPSARVLRARPALASRLIDATGDRLAPGEIVDARAWVSALARRPRSDDTKSHASSAASSHAHP